MQVDQTSHEHGAILSLGGLLNILYRRRFVVITVTALGLAAGIAYGIIVKPLYRGTVQVRPGIVSFTPEGAPVREAALDDIVGWFGKRLYWSDFKTEDEFTYLRTAPVIDAKFVPSLNFVRGGNVITLTNLSRSPEEAHVVLDRAVEAFNHQAEVDSLGSTLHLTRRGAQLRLDRIDQGFARLDAEQERTNLRIEEFKRQLPLVAMERQGIELDLLRLAEENAWRARAVTGFRTEVTAVRGRLGEAEKLLAITLQTEQATGGRVVSGQGSGPVSEVLMQTASREQAGRVGDLLATVAYQSKLAVEGTVRADSLEARIKVNEIEMKRLRLVIDIELAKKQADVEQQIRDQQIAVERDLPRERALLHADQRSEKIKLDLITPLQRVGPINVTEKPVRPRRMRAALLLTFLGLCGGFSLALVWEYFENNQAVITAPRRPR
jgi:hypothetical protein